MRTYTEQDLIQAYQDGAIDFSNSNKTISSFITHDVDEYIESLNPKVEEKTIPLTAGYLLKKLDWEEFCDLTGIDYYAKREGRIIKDDEVFHIPESKVKQFI